MNPSSVASSFAVSVGTGGTAGSAGGGASATNGASGAGGVIIVDEFYD
jgi:hypothetical protein